MCCAAQIFIYFDHMLYNNLLCLDYFWLAEELMNCCIFPKITQENLADLLLFGTSYSRGMPHQGNEN